MEVGRVGELGLSALVHVLMNKTCPQEKDCAPAPTPLPLMTLYHQAKTVLVLLMRYRNAQGFLIVQVRTKTHWWHYLLHSGWLRFTFSSVDGNWGVWFPPGPCSVSCGEGLQLSSRRCDNPSPTYGGKQCEGQSTRTSVCNSPCPGKTQSQATFKLWPSNADLMWIAFRLSVHGHWTGWSNWDECSSSCIQPNGGSFRTRRRSCSNPVPSLNPPGNECQGEDSQTEHCNHLPHCPGMPDH